MAHIKQKKFLLKKPRKKRKRHRASSLHKEEVM